MVSVAPRSIARVALALACAVALPCCISTVDTTRAPCPCGEGTQCCGSLSLCLAPGEQCPARYPPSSKRGCARNADCPRGEACHAWRLPARLDSGVDAAVGGDGDVLAGPQTCQRVCAPAFSCASGERCQLALQDGRPLADANTASLCLDAPPADAGDDSARDAGAEQGPDDGSPDGDASSDVSPFDATVDALAECSKIGCAKCPPNKIGRTYCDGRTLKVCYSALHARCGLVCEQLSWQCDACNEAGGIVQCVRGSSTTPPGVCNASMSCSACPRGATTVYCERNTLRACLRGAVSIPEEPCSGEVCVDRVLEVCAQGCDPAGLTCRR